MQTILIEKLRSFLVEHSPDVLLGLQKDLSVTQYLEDKVYSVMPLVEQLISEGKPQYVIEELCLNELIKDLCPSKFQYIRKILEEEFLQTYEQFRRKGVLTYETINLVEACKPVFEKLGFSDENEGSVMVRYAIINQIQEYLGQQTAI